MNTDQPDFTFGLSRDELLWLTGAFGMSGLPLPEASFLTVPPQELRERQRAGAQSLRQRDLLRAGESGLWQVERLPAALLQTMAAAEAWLRLDYRNRAGMTRSMHFFAAEMRFLLDLAEGYARFCLCADAPTAAEALWGWLALPPGLTAGQGALSLPQPLDFLPLAWNDPGLAARVLTEHGLPAQDVPTVLAWVESLEWVCAASVQELQADGVTTSLRFVACGGPARLWGGFEREGLASLTGLAPLDLRAALSELP